MDVYQLDCRALRDLAALVDEVSDSDLDRPTPCAGWTVRDLLRHMNTEHEAISELILNTPAELDPDPRKAFAYAITRWIEAFADHPADRLVQAPKFGTGFPASAVLSIHLADMLAHRWDLSKALGIDPALPPDLLAAALPIATSIPAEGPLRGPNGYAAPVPTQPDATPTDRLVAALGRVPNWPDH